MKSPLVSVVLPSYNYEAYIGQSIRSVLDQSLDDFELIVIENGSTDNSIGVINQFEDSRIKKIVLESNIGVDVFNFGLGLAKGRYLCNLHADDAYFPGKLERQVEFMERHPEYDLVATHIQSIDEDGELYDSPECPNWVFNHEKDLSSLESYLAENRVNMPSVMLRRHVFPSVGRFRTDLPFLADMDYWVRCALAGHRMGTLAEPLLYYRRHRLNGSVQYAEHSVYELCFYFITFLRSQFIRHGRDDLAVRFIKNTLGNHHVRGLKEEVLANLVGALTNGDEFRGSLEDFKQSMERKPTLENLAVASFMLKQLEQSAQAYRWVRKLETEAVRSTRPDWRRRDRSFLAAHPEKRALLEQETTVTHHLDPGLRVALYGAGSGGDLALETARAAAWQPVFFIDGLPDKWGTEKAGLPVLAPRALRDRAGDFDLIVVASTTGTHEIFSGLHDAGFRFGRDFIFALDNIVVDDRCVTVFY